MRAKGRPITPTRATTDGRNRSTRSMRARTTSLGAHQACQKYVAVPEGGGPPPPSAAHPRPQPPNCASRWRSPSAYANTGPRSSRTLWRRHRTLSRGTSRWAGGCTFPKTLDRVQVGGVRACCQGPWSAASGPSPTSTIGEQHTPAIPSRPSDRRRDRHPQELNGLSVKGAAHGDGGGTFCEQSQWGYRQANFGAHRCLRSGTYGRFRRKSSRWT
jgi:hypothetical protein